MSDDSAVEEDFAAKLGEPGVEESFDDAVAGVLDALAEREGVGQNDITAALDYDEIEALRVDPVQWILDQDLKRWPYVMRQLAATVVHLADVISERE